MSETTRNEKCTDCEHAGTCSSAGFDLTCATGKWARRGSPHRTEETTPEEIREAMRSACWELDAAAASLEYVHCYAFAEQARLTSKRLSEVALRALRSPAPAAEPLRCQCGGEVRICERCGGKDGCMSLPAPAESAAPGEARKLAIEEAIQIVRNMGDAAADDIEEELRYLVDHPIAAPASPPPVAREAAPSDLDALEAQIQAFSRRIGLADNGDLELIGQPSWSVLVPSRWRVRWRRSYCPHGSVVSDWREVEAESLPEALAAAAKWESENDQREPQHALARESAKESK